MKREDDQELWDLLGKDRRPALSPFFSRNVVRRIREERGWRDVVAGWLTPRKLIPATAVALAVGFAAFAAISLPPSSEQSDIDNVPEAVTVIDPQDYEVVADLDNLLASEDDNVWDETESLSL